MRIKIQECLDVCLLHLISDCWEKDLRIIMLHKDKDLHSNKNILHGILIRFTAFGKLKQVKQNPAFCIMSGFNFRALFIKVASHLKNEVIVKVGKYNITDFLQHVLMASVYIKYLNTYNIHFEIERVAEGKNTALLV